MKARLSASAIFLLVAFGTALGADNPAKTAAFSGPNRLTYLDSTDPFYVGRGFAKLATPQWVGEPDVDAVVILSVDDMTETRKYETFLRPLLNRLKQIDGRAPVSIMTRSVPADDPQVQAWLKEGLSLEAHTLNHPCPLLANADIGPTRASLPVLPARGSASCRHGIGESLRCPELSSRQPNSKYIAILFAGYF